VGLTDDGDVVVVGDVDTLAAPTLAGFLSQQSHAGTASVIVDLSAVTFLGSAAVSVLYDATNASARQGAHCSLIAPPGGTAQHVLSVVGLPVTVEHTADRR
jgi:anti-anti-sigma factor